MSTALTAKKLKLELAKHADKSKAKLLSRYFKTGPGEYAEGDIFIGLNVPTVRMIAKNSIDVAIDETIKLLKSPIHEERFLALLILVFKYKKADDRGKKEIYEIYLKNTRYINNWDLVDLTAKHIVGAYLFDKDRRKLYELASSSHLWDRRIAVLATFFFIPRKDFSDSFAIAETLLKDKHDLIHKAAGWMLREIGKIDMAAEETFLRRYAVRMPRTMLRYAIERFPPEKKKFYMAIDTSF